MESTSNRMSRLGKSLITDTELLSLDRIIAEIDAVDADDGRASSPACCSRRSGSRPPGSGPSEERFRDGGRARDSPGARCARAAA